jgi:hypothetical protein
MMVMMVGCESITVIGPISRLLLPPPSAWEGFRCSKADKFIKSMICLPKFEGRLED